jgi:hypothetical protein
MIILSFQFTSLSNTIPDVEVDKDELELDL